MGKLLKSGIKIFDQSVASLQYLIEDHLSSDEFKQQLLGRRTEYIETKKRELQGEEVSLPGHYGVAARR